MSKTIRRIFIFFVVVLLTLPITACAKQDKITKVSEFEVMKVFLADAPVELHEVNDIGSLYEVVVKQGNQKGIIYVTKDGKYVVLGNIFDKAKTNITQKRFTELSKVSFSALPLNDALVTKKGDGSRKLAMFTDVDCGFCRQAHEWLKGKDNYTLYVFLSPMNPTAESYAKSIEILCSDDPIKSLDAVKAGKQIKANHCDKGIKLLGRHLETAMSVNLTGTPLFVTEQDVIIAGFDRIALENYLK